MTETTMPTDQGRDMAGSTTFSPLRKKMAEPNTSTNQGRDMPGSVSKIPNADGSRQAPPPCVRGNHPSSQGGSEGSGSPSLKEGESGDTPLQERGREVHLDSYRVTHRNRQPEASAPSQTGEDCPYSIEVGFDEYDTATGELVDAGIELLPCNRKGCPVCGPKVRDRYVAHFSRTFGDLAKDRPVWFLTLTVDPKVLPEGADEQEARKYLLHCWDKYMKRLRRRADELKYMATFELHKEGDRWHLHVILAARFPDRETEGAVREMLRVQWFESGGGAVGKVKRIREGREGFGPDGRPEGIAGSVGYCVKYAFKDAADAHREAQNRRSLIASQGIGYHSEAAKEARREHFEATDGADSGGSGPTAREYHSLVDRGAKSGGRGDTLTEEDRRRFEALDRSVRTVEYREREEDADPWGRTVWFVWKMDTDGGTLRRTVYDGWPDSEDTEVLESERRIRASDP